MKKLLHPRDYFPLAFWLVLLIVLKLFHREAQTDDLLFLLKPISFLVAQMTGMDFIFVPGQGYLNADSSILIDKSCSGMNYLMILWTTLCFAAGSWQQKPHFKVVLFSFLLPLSYGLAVLANSSRIIQIIFLGKRYPNSVFLHSPMGHEMLGILVYFSLLIVFYLIFQSFNSRKLIPHGKNI